MESQKVQKNVVAIDIGGTLTKFGIHCNEQTALLIFNDQKLQIQKLQICSKKGTQKRYIHMYFTLFIQFKHLSQFIQNKIVPNSKELKIIATGGGALKFQPFFNELISNSTNTPISYVISLNEFQAITPAIKLLTQKYTKCKLTCGEQIKNSLIKSYNNKINLNVPIILANIGSGMSVLKIEQKQEKLYFQRVGGSALGGGFFTGVSKIINQKFAFQSLYELDFLITSQPQQIQTMKQCIQNLSQIISLYSDIYKIQTILITGGLAKSQIIQDQFYSNLKNKQVYFTQIDGYLSVIGLLLHEKSIQIEIKND